MVGVLVLLAVYYAYTQRYLCTGDHKDNSTTQSESNSSNTDSTSDGSSGTTPEHIKLTSQNSSQQELMSSSEGEEDFRNINRLREHQRNRLYHPMIV